MQIPNDAMLLRIFIGESDRWHHQPLYEAIVLKARETASGRRHRAARADGLWQIEPPAHRENSAALDGSAARHRDRGQRGKNQCLPARARRDDRRRPGDAGKIKVIHYRHEKPKGA